MHKYRNDIAKLLNISESEIEFPNNGKYCSLCVPHRALKGLEQKLKSGQEIGVDVIIVSPKIRFVANSPDKILTAVRQLV